MRTPDLSRFAGPAALVGVCGLIGLFLFAGLRGDHGTQALAEAKARKAALQGELAAVRAEREAAENRARRLTRAYLDLDLLEERARSVLGHVRAGDIVIEPVAR